MQKIDSGGQTAPGAASSGGRAGREAAGLGERQEALAVFEKFVHLHPKHRGDEP